MAFQSVGDVSTWWGLYQSPSDVYLYRFLASGIREEGGRPKNPLDLLDFVSAVGRAQSRNLDVRAVTAWKPDGSPNGQFMIDVVCTSVYALPTTTWNEPDLLQVIKNDAAVVAHFPELAVSGGGWYQIASPQNTIEFWRARPVLWDHALTTKLGGHGGATSAFGTPPDHSVAWGRADDQVTSIRSLVPPRAPTFPPGPTPGGPAGPLGKESGMSWAELLIGASIVGMIVWAVRGPGSRKYHDDEEYG